MIELKPLFKFFIKDTISFDILLKSLAMRIYFYCQKKVLPFNLFKLYAKLKYHFQLHSVSTHAFISLHNLHSLFLSHNDLESVHHETLTGLSVLSYLAIDHNKLHTLHTMALKNCSVLEEIRLNHNILTQVSKLSFCYSSFF